MTKDRLETFIEGSMTKFKNTNWEKKNVTSSVQILYEGYITVERETEIEKSIALREKGTVVTIGFLRNSVPAI